MRDFKEYTLLSASAVLAVTSSTDATPIVVTKATHGLVTGDRITINGHTTNTNANGTWVVTKLTANTFSLDGSTATGGGAGGATGCFAKQNAIAFAEDFSHAVLSFDTDGSGAAAMTVKLVGSIAYNCPDFARPQAASNSFEFIDMADLQSGSSIDGDTGFVVATADDHRLFEANVNGIRWLAVLPTAGTAGSLTVKIKLYTKD